MKDLFAPLTWTGPRGWRQVTRNFHNISAAGDGKLVLHQVHNTRGLPLRALLLELKPVLQSD
jgi:hypothetical protein